MPTSPPERYPPAPWRLSGTSIQAIRLIDANVARRSVPDDLRIVTVWPRRTLAVLYCASYELPSALEYRELILAPALVATGGRVGFWISHIYVDDAASQAGGRAIWGLPKELATFAWNMERQEVSVRSQALLLCRLRWNAGRLSVPMPVYLPAISRVGGHYRFFSGRGSASVTRAAAKIDIPTGSPLDSSGFARTRTLAIGRRLNLRVGAPRPRD